MSITQTKTHLIIKVPLSKLNKDFSEEEVLTLADEGIKEYKSGKTQSFDSYIVDKHPDLTKS